MPTVIIAQISDTHWSVRRSDLAAKCKWAIGFVWAMRDGTYEFWAPDVNSQTARDLRKLGWRSQTLKGLASVEEAAKAGARIQ